MATVGLYGSSTAGVVPAASGSESNGLYGNNVNFGGSYFEWFIFQQSDTQPATPTGGSWDFATNSGTPPIGWSTTPFSAPTNKIWVSIALVNSKNASSLTWCAPGLFSYASGLPVLSGTGTPGVGVGQSDQFYIQLDTTPQTIWFKESGTWTRITGSTLYADLTSNQTIAGTKTFSSQIQGSISGTASNVTGVVGITNGGTGATTASGARTSLGAAASGANSDITSLSGITGSIGTADYVAFDTTYATTLAAGQLGWDGNNTLGLGMAGGNVIQRVGEDVYFYIKASSAITKGQLIMFTGAVGASGVLTGAPSTGLTDGQYIMGVAAETIALNGFGLVQHFGTVRGFDTTGSSVGETWADGDILYYNPSYAGGLTKFMPTAPNVKATIAVVTHAGNGGSGSLFVRPSTGSVLGLTDSNVQFGTLSTGDLIRYNGTYWTNVASTSAAVTTFSGGTTGLTPSTATSGAVTLAGTLGIANGGTGQTTANAAFNALAPSQTGNSGKYLTTDGTNTSWATNPLGTVTSVNASGGTTGLTFSGGPVTTSGTLTLAGTLAVANGGTGVTTSTGTGSVVLSTSPTLVTPALGTPVSGNFSTGTFTWPTFNQNTTGNAATATTATNVSGGTANVTTLTTSSTVTLNGGTANGVAYLNGSKVLTTGSALTFDGTSFTNTQAGGTATLQYNSLSFNRVGDTYVTASSGPLNMAGTRHTWRDETQVTEWMRLTSTGLGIGTSSPLGKLDVRSANGVIGTMNTSTAAVNNTAQITLAPATAFTGAWSGGPAVKGLLENATSFATAITINPYSGSIGQFEAARFDSFGNLGIGTTSPAGKLDVVATSAGGTTYNYFQNNGASGVSLVGLAFAQSNAIKSSITAAVYGNDYMAFNVGSNTERMRIDASGNLGLGVTPSAWTDYKVLQLGGAGAVASDGVYTTELLHNAFYSTGFKYKNTAAAARYSVTNGQHQWFNAPSGTAGNAISFTQAMTLTANSELIVGTTSTGGALRVYGSSGKIIIGDSSYNYFDADTQLFRNFAGTERARIDSSGNLLVGTTSTYGGPGRINVGFNQSTNFGITLRNTSASATGVFVSFENSGGTGNGSITQTNSTTVAYNTSSDRRLKKNIVPATDAGADIDAITIVSHDWLSNDDHVKYGVIAQDLIEIAPQSVRKGDDGAEVVDTWGVDYSKLVPMLVKEIQSLRARVAQLESN